MSEQQHTTPRQREVPWWVPFCRWLWNAIPYIWGTLGVGILIGTIANMSTLSVLPGTSLRTTFAQTFLGRLLLSHPLLIGGGIGILIVLTVLIWLGKREPTFSSANASPLSKQNRIYLLGRLGGLYQQMKEQSLQEAVRISLNFVTHPGAVSYPASLALRFPSQPEQTLPTGNTILQVYKQANQELLILGEPGAGKSTLLLELAHALVKQAEQDATHPLPVLLPLSTWATKRPPLQEWLIDQFALLYNVPRKLSHQWVEAELMLPLLDGLDEMDEAVRPACVAAINSYHREHLHPLVVCSRTREYEQATHHKRLALQTAVVVQPLTSVEVDAHLVTLGKPLVALRAALKKNQTLVELATTPLMLQILILTYAGTTVRQFSQKKAELEQQIWTAYVEQMVARKGDHKHYPLDRTVSWLRWLAQQMRQHNQTIFFLEFLQPDTLAKPRRNLYQWSIVILHGLAYGLLYGLLFGLIFGLVIGLLVGLVFGLALGLSEGEKSDIQPAEGIVFSWKSFLAGLLIGLLVGLVRGLPGGLPVGLLGGLLVGLLVGLLYGLKNKQFSVHQALTPNEGIKRSFKNGLVVLLLAGLLGGLLVGLLGGLLFGLLGGPLVGLPLGLPLGLRVVIQHYTLRFWLWSLRLFPLKAIPFLEDATARILLRRVGGGYSFTHRLLMDYFANLNSDAPAPATKTQPGQQSPPW